MPNPNHDDKGRFASGASGGSAKRLFNSVGMGREEDGYGRGPTRKGSTTEMIGFFNSKGMTVKRVDSNSRSTLKDPDMGEWEVRNPSNKRKVKVKSYRGKMLSAEGGGRVVKNPSIDDVFDLL